jgi:uncharacterized protein YkwD
MLARSSSVHDRHVRPLYLLLAVVAVAATAVALWPRDSSRPPDPCGAVDERPQESGIGAAGQATVCLVNRERTTRGLPALRQNGLLTQASAEHSQDMVRRDYFEHTSADGRTVGDRLRAIGYSRGFSASAGENIAYGVGDKATPAAIVAAWMRSPGHRADILRPAFTEIGIGIALGAPEVAADRQSVSATYTTDFGGVVDPSLPSG